MQEATRALAPYAAVAIVGLAALVTAARSPVEAQGYDRPGRHYAGPRYVVAESQWGNGTISGPIRPGPNGWQVRLPRGTWIDCVWSCSDTLRRATIDFWQTNGPNAPGSGRGYLTWEFRF
jgi:hypothetical protein